MSPASRFQPALAGRSLPAQLCLLLSVIGVLFLSGCLSSFRRSPGRTVLETKTTLPARVISNFFVVETKLSDGKTYRFIVDTGSTATLISPELAKKFAMKERHGAPRRKVHVRSASGGEIDLEAVTLRRLSLGDALFERVPALIFDFTDLSGHLGVPIDGIVGFPVFRNTLLTMDYPGNKLVIESYPEFPGPRPPSSLRVSPIAFNNEEGTPLIPIQMGNESFIVLIDSGNDGSLSLNPVGLHPHFANGPRVGTLISSLQGDRRQLTGRLSQKVLIGTQAIENPIVDLTDQLSSIGGEFLRHFVVTFDQLHNQVTFTRDADGPVIMEARRSTQLVAQHGQKLVFRPVRGLLARAHGHSRHPDRQPSGPSRRSLRAHQRRIGRAMGLRSLRTTAEVRRQNHLHLPHRHQGNRRGGAGV